MLCGSLQAFNRVLAVSLLCSGFSHSRVSYVAIRNFVLCVIGPVLVVIGRKHVTRTQ